MARHERSYAIRTMAMQAMERNETGLIFTPVRSPYTPGLSHHPAKL